MHEYTVEFRVEGPKVEPARITAEIGLEPSRVREVGSQGKDSKTRTAIWSYEGSGDIREWKTLEEGLLHVLQDLRPKKKLIGTYSRKFDVYWWCGHFQSSFDGGPTFSRELLNDLAKFGVPLILNNYFSRK